VRSLVNRGANVIKVSLQVGFPMLTFDVLRAIVEETHAHDLRVTAHVGEGRGARLALRAGVDELAHMPCFHEPELMRELAEAGMEIVATLHVVTIAVGCPGLVENAADFHRAGGTLLYGSDFGVVGIPPGVVVAELELLAESGLGIVGALRAATSEAARFVPVDRIGRLAGGYRADVVAVRGDPTRDLDALSEPVLIVRDGRVDLGG
jgi:imidazolonepropionase-like amidohydrolase